MFGFLIGFLSLIGLFKVLRGGRHGHWHGRHHRRCRHRHGGRGFRGRHFGRWLDHAFERLDTSPGQEKEIRDAIRELMDEAYNLKGEAREMKGATQAAFGPALFDEGPLDDAFAKQDDKIVRLRVAIKHALQRIHEALDEEQRKEMQSWLKRMGGRGFAAPDFGPYR